jgi:hypothetical protein
VLLLSSLRKTSRPSPYIPPLNIHTTGPLHHQVLQPGHIWVVSPGRGFYTLCARDARVKANHPTLLGAIGKPVAFASGVVIAAVLAAVACASSGRMGGQGSAPSPTVPPSPPPATPLIKHARKTPQAQRRQPP